MSHQQLQSHCSSLGPFAPCYEFVDPQVVYDACVMDLCVSLKPSFSCYIMKIYAQQCRQAGGNPGDWRKDAQHCFVEGNYHGTVIYIPDKRNHLLNP